ncbi:response regulator transcription factor [soil metagenome]
MRILVVEDETKLANAIKRALELQKYAVDVAYDGESGHDLAVVEKYDIILLDSMLPGMDGIEICSNLRKESIHTPILMLTAKGQIADKVTALDIGADDYMVKPFSFDELFARIRALVRRPGKTEESILRIGDLTLDPMSFEVKRGETYVNLSTKEYALLQYLMQNRNMVLSKEQIISHIWDYEADILPGTVEVHIKHLRDKIDKSHVKALIHTVRGFGYKIEDK